MLVYAVTYVKSMRLDFIFVKINSFKYFYKTPMHKNKFDAFDVLF